LNGLGEHNHWQIQVCFNHHDDQMIAYCKGLVEKKQAPGLLKENWVPQKFHEFGVRPKGQGARTDLDAVVDLVKSGGTLTDVAIQCPIQFIKFNSGIAKWQAQIEPKRCWPMKVYWCWGPTGSGKSRWAFENTNDPYYKDPNSKWWCGYAGQEEVIIDDFRPSKEMPFNFMLALLDRYPMRVEGKCTSHQFVSKRIIITSPNDVDTTLRDLQWVGAEAVMQFKRRITKELEFKRDGLAQHLNVFQEEEVEMGAVPTRVPSELLSFPEPVQRSSSSTSQSLRSSMISDLQSQRKKATRETRDFVEVNQRVVEVLSQSDGANPFSQDATLSQRSEVGTSIGVDSNLFKMPWNTFIRNNGKIVACPIRRDLLESWIQIGSRTFTVLEAVQILDTVQYWEHQLCTMKAVMEGKGIIDSIMEDRAKQL
jgi:hypothetical protein